MTGVLLLAFIFFTLFSTGKFQTDHPPQLIEVQEGGNATIQCRSHPTVNLEKYTLDVKRVDGNSSDPSRIVYSRRHGKAHPVPQMEQYRNRVFLNEEDLKRGVLTLVIRPVRPSDSGRYKCYIPKQQAASFSTIVVKDKQNGTEENEFSTMATSVEEMTDAGKTGAATEEHQRHRVAAITVPILCLILAAAAAVFLVLVKKGICMSQKKSEGNDSELETLSVQAKEGDEEQLKKPSTGGVGGLAG